MKINKPRMKVFLKVFKPCFGVITFISLLLVMTSAYNADNAIRMIIPALIVSIVTATLLTEFLLKTFKKNDAIS